MAVPEARKPPAAPGAAVPGLRLRAGSLLHALRRSTARSSGFVSSLSLSISLLGSLPLWPARLATGSAKAGWPGIGRGNIITHTDLYVPIIGGNLRSRMP